MEQEVEAVKAAEVPLLSPGCAEAVRDELLDECEEHFEVLQQVIYPFLIYKFYFILFFLFVFNKIVDWHGREN